MTRTKRDGSPDDLWFTWWRNEPWPDEFVEAMVSPLPDYEPEPDTAKFLAYQVAIRVRQRLPVPPLLQEWFNRYVALEDGYVPQLLPDRQVFDRAAVEFLKLMYGMTKTDAIKLIAKESGREFKTVEANVYRKEPVKIKTRR